MERRLPDKQPVDWVQIRDRWLYDRHLRGIVEIIGFLALLFCHVDVAVSASSNTLKLEGIF